MEVKSLCIDLMPDRQIHGQTDTHRYTDRQTHTDTRTDRQANTPTDRHTDRQTDRHRYTDRQTGKYTDRQTHTDTRTDTQTDRYTDRQADIKLEIRRRPYTSSFNQNSKRKKFWKNEEKQNLKMKMKITINFHPKSSCRKKLNFSYQFFSCD